MAVSEFDYSKLDPAFSSLAKPVQRALVTAKIYTPKDLAKWDMQDVLELHGIGKSSIPVLTKLARK